MIVRSRPAHDGAEPSGNSIAALALLRLARVTGRADFHVKARGILEAGARLLEQSPLGFLRLLCALDFLLHPPKEIVVVGPKVSPETTALARTVHSRFLPNKILVHLDPEHGLEDDFPLLRGKTMVNGRATAYVCQDGTCGTPATTQDALLAQLIH